MLINNENDMFLHTHLFNNTTKVNRAKRGALRLILGGARPMQVRNLERGPLTVVSGSDLSKIRDSLWDTSHMIWDGDEKPAKK